MNKKQKQDIELGIAAALVVAWQATVCYSALANKAAIGYLATVIFALCVYIAWRADREEKARKRRTATAREELDKAMNELEAWREARESD